MCYKLLSLCDRELGQLAGCVKGKSNKNIQIKTELAPSCSNKKQAIRMQRAVASNGYGVSLAPLCYGYQLAINTTLQNKTGVQHAQRDTTPLHPPPLSGWLCIAIKEDKRLILWKA